MWREDDDTVVSVADDDVGIAIICEFVGRKKRSRGVISCTVTPKILSGKQVASAKIAEKIQMLESISETSTSINTGPIL